MRSRVLQRSSDARRYMGVSWAAFLSIAIVVMMACSNATDNTQVAQTPAPAGDAPPALQMALASSDISVGSNRVAFGIIDSESGPLRGADVAVSTFFLTSTGQEGPVETVNAVFRQWPVAPRGIYTAQLSFDRPGTWGLGASITEADGSARQASVAIQVKEESATPAIGSPAPRSDSKTSDDVGGFEQLTTDADPDPALYEMTIAEAIDAGKPLVVSFSTPAYCQTATCGPQLEVVKEIKQDYSDRVNFIHVEVYDNPDEIQGDLSNAVVSPTLAEWGLPSEPWTFILDGDGIIRAKFEAFTTREELEDALVEVLQ